MITKEHFDLMGEVLREDIKKSFDVWVKESPEASLMMRDFNRVWGKVEKRKWSDDNRDG
jgi:hypothetical protein